MNLERLELPSGGWVEFDDPDHLAGEDQRRLVSTLDDAPETGAGYVAALDTAQGIACLLIQSWHIPYTPRGTDYPAGEVPVPSNDWPLLGKLRLSDYNAILTHIRPVARLLFPAAPTPDQATVPGSPTVPTGG